MRFIIALIFSLLFATTALHTLAVAQGQFSVSTTGPSPLQTLKIGAGGFATGVDVNTTDGTVLIPTDTYGAYQFTGTVWNQLVTSASFPTANFGFAPPNTLANQVFQGTLGVYAITSAPSLSSVVYIAIAGGAAVDGAFQGHILKSTNGGVTFTNTTFDQSCTCFMNGSTTGTGSGSARLNGPKMAVAPGNSNNLVLVGVQAASGQTGGVWATTDGNTFLKISNASIPSETEYAIAFDNSDATGNTAYVCAATSGVYESTNATLGSSSTWTLTAAGPASCQHLKLAASTGVVLVTDGSGIFWSYSGTTWIEWNSTGAPSPNSGWHSVAADPSNCTVIATCHIVLGNSSNITYTAGLNGGSTAWAESGFARVCTNDVGWLCTTNEFSMTNGDMAFDLTGGTLNFAEGKGVWNGTPPTSAGTVSWQSRNQGIENLVTWSNIIAPNGMAVMGFEDVGVTGVPNPSSYLNNGTLFTLGQTGGVPLPNSTAVDYATSNTNFMVAQQGGDSNSMFEWSAYNTNGGAPAQWVPFNTGWWSLVPAGVSTISSGTSGQCGGTAGCVIVNVSTASAGSVNTTGITGWSAGSGSIICAVQQGQTTGTGNGNITNKCSEALFVSSTQVALANITWTSANSLVSAGNFLFYTSSFPSSNHDGQYMITGVTGTTGGGTTGLMQLTLVGTAPPSGAPMYVAGTTCCDGFWLAGSSSGLTTQLQGSVCSSCGAAWSGVGQVGAFPVTGGGIAASTPQNIVRVPGQHDYPYCTTNGGQSWAEIPTPSGGWPHYSNITGATLSGNVTFTTATDTNMPTATQFSANAFTVAGNSNASYNGTYTATTGTGGSTVVGTPVSATPSGAFGTGGVIFPTITGFGNSFALTNHIVVADRSVPNTFYIYNFSVAAIYQVTNCTATQLAGSVVTPPNSGYTSFSDFNGTLASVPGQAGHLFYTAGEVGGAGASHPTNTSLWRTCNANAGGAGAGTMSAVTGFFEPWGVGFGAAKVGGTGYPVIYVVSWFSATNNRNTAKFGIWYSDDDGSSGGTTCTGGTWHQLVDSQGNAVDFPLGWMSFSPSAVSLTGSLTSPGQLFILNGNGAAYGLFNLNFLLEGDLHRGAPANDNDDVPTGLNKAA